MVAQADIQMIVDRIVRQFHPLRVILFGSYARDEGRPDSDIDLLVVLAKVEDKRRAAVAIYNALDDLTIPTDVVVTSPEEIELRGQAVGNVLRPALSEGRILYDAVRPAK